MQDLTEYRDQLITQFDLISKKYEDTPYTLSSIDCMYQELFNLYKFSIEPFLGRELGKKLFKESLIQYFDFACGVTLFENLFNEKRRNRKHRK